MSIAFSFVIEYATMQKKKDPKQKVQTIRDILMYIIILKMGIQSMLKSTQ